jgi:hypothetical protein
MGTMWQRVSWRIPLVLLALGIMVGASAMYNPLSVLAEETTWEGGAGQGWDCNEMDFEEWCSCIGAAASWGYTC